MSGKIEISRELAEEAIKMLRHFSPSKTADAIEAALESTEEQHQEPVAWRIEYADDGELHRISFSSEQAERLGKDRFYRVSPLFTSPPAPVADDMVRLLTRARIYARGEFRDEIDACLAGKTEPVVVLPERKQSFDDFTFDGCRDQGWNACLDKVKEMSQ